MHKLLIAMGLLMLLPGCSVNKKYAKFNARCQAQGDPDDCFTAASYAHRAERFDESKELLKRNCAKNHHEDSCIRLAQWFPGVKLTRTADDRLNTTEQLSPAEAEKYVSRNIHWKIDSDPRGAIVNYRINSATEEVSSTSSIYLERTPYEAVRRFDIKGLTTENMKHIRVVLEVERKGYFPQRKEMQLSSVIQQGEVGAYFSLEKKD